MSRKAVEPYTSSSETQAKLRQLAQVHDQWVAGRLGSAPFDPQDRKAGSDYNQHFVDIDGDDDAFHEAAARIFS